MIWLSFWLVLACSKFHSEGARDSRLPEVGQVSFGRACVSLSGITSDGSKASQAGLLLLGDSWTLISVSHWN
jgi:hypothetical protein